MARFIVQAVVLLQVLHVVAGLAFWQPSNSAAKIPDKCRVLILPGFGNASVDYTMNGSLVSSLVSRGWQESQIDVLPVERSDWLKVFFRGALDIEFWRANASPIRPAFRWYLDLIAAKVKELEEDESMILVGHSAGGWLARAAVGYGNQDTDEGLSIDGTKIKGIVTLGAPNLPPPPEVMDMTRGALRIMNEDFPYASSTGVPMMVTVIGTPVQGVKQERKSPFEPTTMTGFAFNSYEAVCGDGTTIGDGVVPQCAAHVDGATQLNLEDVFHSINVPDKWYGSEKVIDEWHDTMLAELNMKARNAFNPSKLLNQ